MLCVFDYINITLHNIVLWCIYARALAQLILLDAVINSPSLHTPIFSRFPAANELQQASSSIKLRYITADLQTAG